MKFAVRLSILGMVFIVMLSVIGLRLWFMQVAQGPAIARAAEEQAWLTKTTHASRGEIYDRNGNLLVTSRLVPAVFIDRTFVQPEAQETLIQRLSSILGLDSAVLTAAYEEAGINGRFQVATVDKELASQISEQLSSLPGVEIVKVPERVYLVGDTMAHVIGHLGLPDQADLDARDELDPSIRIGKLGVEAFYDDVLQGVSGRQDYRVLRGEMLEQSQPVPPVPGDSIVLTLDSELQTVVELALAEGITLSNEVKDIARADGEEVFNETTRAAAVVLDPNTFEVLALASVPDFDPQVFVTGIDTETFAALNESFAFNNLAVSGLYPPGSTFKAITYTAFLEENLPLPSDVEGIDPESRTVDCDGLFTFPLNDGSAQEKKDWYYPRELGVLDLHGALENSCNKFFWSVGLGTWLNRETVGENVIQDWAVSLGYGHETGIDLANEAAGIVPTRQLFEEWADYQREHPDEQPRLEPSRLNPELASPFFGGDLMDFAIGQGAFTATPLQAAVSYSILANGGRVLEPRVVDRIVAPEGDVIEEVTSPLVDTVDISESTRTQLLEDLNRVVTSGTAASAFAEFGPGLELVGGKTGTSQTARTKDNTAWFIGVAPIDNPQYVVAVVIDEGGSGGAIAAPVARHILQYLMGNEPGPITAGDEAD
ncbi:MAG TPA: penicillin-binding transpeptidase domain-containing protein [Acidimicrobiia bacterium]|jgi:penicillin-binding protein 2|nr:penicillin-binding transpeptidase domain-containing protein [Acidimicrobiia bacterium]